MKLTNIERIRFECMLNLQEQLTPDEKFLITHEAMEFLLSDMMSREIDNSFRECN